MDFCESCEDVIKDQVVMTDEMRKICQNCEATNKLFDDIPADLVCTRTAKVELWKSI